MHLFHRTPVFTLAALVLVALAGDLWAENRGAAIYTKQCAECHGSTGEGVPGEYDDALYGDRSIESLARVIEKTMPEEDPKLCVGDDARAVAAYIFDAFYSPEALERIGRAKKAEIDLARLTVPQYRNTVADLLGRFALKMPPGEQREGLQAEYFNSKGMNKKDGKSQAQVDARMEFDFGEAGPLEGIGAEQFSIVWDGSFYAPETGHYEFRTSTPNGVRAYINMSLDRKDRNYRDDSTGKRGGITATIDDWVSSGKEVRQATTRMYLVGGRHYPIRLDYFKYKEKLGSVKLEWKPPHAAWRVMAGADLSPRSAPRVFVVDTPFPADDRSLGYERGSAVSKDWFEASTRGALATANEVLDRLEELSRVKGDDPQRVEKLKAFCARFAEIAFRRPLADGDREQLVERSFKGAETPEIAVKRFVIRCLTSPRFLYPELRQSDTPPDGYAIASRLSYALWDSAPDLMLLKAAQNGQLKNKKAVEKHAVRLLKDVRAKQKMHGFFEHWLEMEERDLSKDKRMYPDFNEAVIADLRQSLLLFVDSVLWGDRPDYRQLLQADYLLLNERLKELYAKGGGKPAVNNGFDRVPVDPSRRAGVLTHPYLLSAFAYHNSTSPIHRGVFLTRNVVGRGLKPPPVAVAFKDDEFDPKLTMRQKVTELTRDAACMSCHSVINPLGFSLENFDAVGRWREKDNKKPINTKSDYTTVGGKTILLSSARDIANYAATSPNAHAAFVTQLFNHLVKQPAAAYGKGTLTDLRTGFRRKDFNMRQLMVEIVTTAAVHGTPASKTASNP